MNKLKRADIDVCVCARLRMCVNVSFLGTLVEKQMAIDAWAFFSEYIIIIYS